MWHKKLSHLNFKTMNDVIKKDLVKGISKLKFPRMIYVMLIKLETKKKSSFISKK